MSIHIFNHQSALTISDEDIERLVSLFLKWKGVAYDAVMVHFVTQEAMSRLHENYFQDPSPTDCISFPIDSPDDSSDGYKVLGEVFVCPEVAIEYAREHGENPYYEASLYLVHGLLHLLGYDDQDDADLSIMRAQESSAMIYLEKNEGVLKCCLDH